MDASKPKGGLRSRMKTTMFGRRAEALGIDLVLVALASLPVMLLVTYLLSVVDPSRTENPFEQIAAARRAGTPVLLRVEMFSYEPHSGIPAGTLVIGEGKGWIQEIFVFYAYFVFCFRFGGRTLGKRWLKLKVVRSDGSPLGWWNAFERAHGYVCSASLILIGFFQVLWDAHGKTLHDRIAETDVIRVRRTDLRLSRRLAASGRV